MSYDATANGVHVGDIVQSAETAVEKTTGLRGWLGQFAQFGAVGLIGLLLFLHQRDNAAQSREDRAMFREELKETRIDHKEATQRLAVGLDAVKAAVEVNTSEVKRVSAAIKAKP